MLFEIDELDIAALSDADLRELVARLCEATLRERGLPTSTVTWGGSQDAPDGGVDVRVDLPAGSAVAGHVPRAATAFQVKKPDMPPKAIAAEMRPGGVLRAAIRELVGAGGAYVIASSSASLADAPLRRRQKAMREAVLDWPGADALHLDFYDRRRLSRWANEHPGPAAWVRERVGRPLRGWRAHGAWTAVPEGRADEYLLDGDVRVHYGRPEPGPGDRGTGALPGIERVRTALAVPGASVRLVGLSGVGKTRFAQALFEGRVGRGALDPARVLYTDATHGPEPDPATLAAQLRHERKRAVLVVDNCPPDAHRRLTEACRGAGSTVGLVTIEYDIRDDQPEGTEVVRLEAASAALIERLVRSRHPAISEVDVGTIARFSEGNARVALALANTLERGGTLAGLSDDELFVRLFQQRHAADRDLLAVAEACSLFYSFNGDDAEEPTGELAAIAELSETTVGKVCRAVAELGRRDLMQSRGVWRALLPHAVANRSAKRALEDIPASRIERRLRRPGSERLLRSFSRRLGYLHDSPRAVGFAERWLSPEGLLADIGGLGDLGWAVLVNIAPLAPERVLAALERLPRPAFAQAFCSRRFDRMRLAPLLRRIAYEASLFERSVALLVRLAAAEGPEARKTGATDLLISMFALRFSGTHASAEQRRRVVEDLLRSDEPELRELGAEALGQALRVRDFSPHRGFDFGARSRDHGASPATADEFRRWFSCFLASAAAIGASDLPAAPRVRAVLGGQLPALLGVRSIRDELDAVARRVAGAAYWTEGWAGCRKAMWLRTRTRTGARAGEDVRSGPDPDGARLEALERALAPKALSDRIEAHVLGPRWPLLEAEGSTEAMESASRRAEAVAEGLGRELADGGAGSERCLPRIFSGNHGLCRSFGRGYAAGVRDLDAAWRSLVALFAEAGSSGNGLQVLAGFLCAAAERCPARARAWLDAAVEQPALAPWFPVLQVRAGLDDAGRARVLRSFGVGAAPAASYEPLGWGGSARTFALTELRDLLVKVAALPGGWAVAVGILAMRLSPTVERDGPERPCPEIAAAGLWLLERLEPGDPNPMLDHHLGFVASACLVGAGGAAAAARIADRLIEDHATRFDTFGRYPDLLKALFKAQPSASLDAFLRSGGPASRRRGLEGLDDDWEDASGNPVDAAPLDALLAWCAKAPGGNHEAAASLIRYARASPDGAGLGWTEAATALLEDAPDKVAVLRRFTARFRPSGGWTGSLAGIIESRASLLGVFEDGGGGTELAAFARDERERLRREAERTREWEAQSFRRRSETFE